MAQEHAEFVEILRGLLSVENEQRAKFEETYDGIPEKVKVIFLVNTMKDLSWPVEVRGLAAVLLRRLYTSSFYFWDELSNAEKNGVQVEMLSLAQVGAERAIARKYCDAVAEFARNMLDDDGNNTWPDVVKFLMDGAASDNVQMKENALHIFGVVPGIFGAAQNQYLDMIKNMLHSCIADQQNHTIRFAAVKACCMFVNANEKDAAVLSHLRCLLPGIVQGVAESIEKQEDDDLLKAMVELAENCPKFLRSQLETIVSLCCRVVGTKDFESQWRQLALELIVTLAETAPAMVRKVGKFLNDLVPQILSMMVELDDDDDWSTQDEVEDDDADSNPIAAESALDRLACGLGGKTMLPHITGNVPNMLQNPDWKYRHAALMAISACGEGCHKQMETLLGQIVDVVLPFLQDPHPRVRYAACNCLGQMSTDFGPNFQKKFHAKVVPSLLVVLDDHANPRVQAHAGAALVNFSEDGPKSTLLPYLDRIVEKLEQVINAKFKELLERGTKMVLEQAVTTLAAIADTSEEKFIAHYDRFMPCLKYIVQNATNPELRLLRGKTIECISLIGLAVGKEKFMSDCSEVMQLLLQTQTTQEMADDDPQVSYMISAWARMCKILGKEFEQYLPMVMGPVLKAANLKPEVTLVDNDDMKAMENDTDWQFVTLGEQQSFGIRTSGLEEKATACQMLVCYARELKDGFASYAEEVCKIMVAHLKFYFHDGVRSAASECLPSLLQCAEIRGPDYLANMWSFMCPELLKAMDTEPEQDLKAEHMHAFAECVERMGKGCLNDEQFLEVGRILENILNDHFNKQVERQEKRKDEDYDEVVEETLVDEDDEDVYMLSKISDIMHALFGTHKEGLLPFFERLLPQFVRLIQPSRPWADRQWGICVFDDLVEHCGPRSQPYQGHFLAFVVQSITDTQPEVRQAALYGVGVMGMAGGEPFKQACQEALPVLVKVIEDPLARETENIAPTENGISAVTKILKAHPDIGGAQEVLSRFLSWLPVWEDAEEAVHIYNFLADAVESNNMTVLGENTCRLPDIVSIIADAFEREILEKNENPANRFLNIVRQLQTNDELFQSCVKGLSEEQRQALHEALTSQ